MKTIESVLIVEDNPIDVFINTRVIEQTGLTKAVVVQPSAKAALEYLEETAINDLPGVIFLDIRMPDMDGFEFLDAFRSLSRPIQDTCRVVMLSSSIDPLDDERSSNYTAVVAFIPKPLTRDKILALAPILSLE
jgi:CheY-like chemotaxis protein